MAYKHDSELVIANKFGAASSDAKALLYETYDRLRDITVSGGTSSGTGFEAAGGFLWQMARMFAPSAFMTTLGGTTAFNIPGTSYWSPVNGGTAYNAGTTAAFGLSNLGNYLGFPSGYAAGISTGGAAMASSILSGFGTDYSSYTNLMSGVMTGGASSVGSIADIASAASYGIGTANGYGLAGTNFVLPIAGMISGWGGIMQAAAPYLGEFGLPAIVMGNLMQGTSSAALSAYQNVSSNILSNADTILSNKVRNIETVCKMLDTQGEIVRKMLKEGIDSDSKAIQNLS